MKLKLENDEIFCLFLPYMNGVHSIFWHIILPKFNKQQTTMDFLNLEVAISFIKEPSIQLYPYKN